MLESRQVDIVLQDSSRINILATFFKYVTHPLCCCGLVNLILGDGVDLPLGVRVLGCWGAFWHNRWSSTHILRDPAMQSVALEWVDVGVREFRQLQTQLLTLGTVDFTARTVKTQLRER